MEEDSEEAGNREDEEEQGAHSEDDQDAVAALAAAQQLDLCTRHKVALSSQAAVSTCIVLNKIFFSNKLCTFFMYGLIVQPFAMGAGGHGGGSGTRLLAALLAALSN